MKFDSEADEKRLKVKSDNIASMEKYHLPAGYKGRSTVSTKSSFVSRLSSSLSKASIHEFATSSPKPRAQKHQVTLVGSNSPGALDLFKTSKFRVEKRRGTLEGKTLGSFKSPSRVEGVELFPLFPLLERWRIFLNEFLRRTDSNSELYDLFQKYIDFVQSEEFEPVLVN